MRSRLKMWTLCLWKAPHRKNMGGEGVKEISQMSQFLLSLLPNHSKWSTPRLGPISPQTFLPSSRSLLALSPPHLFLYCCQVPSPLPRLDFDRALILSGGFPCEDLDVFRLLFCGFLSVRGVATPFSFFTVCRSFLPGMGSCCSDPM